MEKKLISTTKVRGEKYTNQERKWESNLTQNEFK